MASTRESVELAAASPRGAAGVNTTVALMVGILAVAIVFSLGAAAVAIHGADPELPDEYHWEGAQFDHDVALAQRASDLGIRASVQFSPAGTCRVLLHMAGASPPALTLALIHGTQPQLDRRARLRPQGAGYEGVCGTLASAHYHLELGDEPGTWRIRAEINSSRDSLELTAQRPGK